jgi:DNA modification methylase
VKALLDVDLADDRFVQVWKGDAWDALTGIPDASVDLLITSPPYWGLRTYGQSQSTDLLTKWREISPVPQCPPGYEWYRRNGGVLGLEPYPEWYVSHLAELLDQVEMKLRPGGSMWINLGDTYFARWSSLRPDGRQGLGSSIRQRRVTPSGDYRVDKQLLLLPARFAIAMQEYGWVLRNDLIWSKAQTAPRPEKDRLRHTHEHLFHFVRRRPRGRAEYYYDRASVEPENESVVRVPVTPGRAGHSATFPRALVEPRIVSSCPPGGVVLDPFCGTGTALSIAVETGRSAIGVDQSARWAKSAASELGLLLDQSGVAVTGRRVA